MPLFQHFVTGTGLRHHSIERRLLCAQAEEIPEDIPVADETPNAPQGWLFEAEAEDADLPPDIKALLKEQAEEEQMGSTQDRSQEELKPESAMIFGASDSPEDLQALPKVSTGSRDGPPCQCQNRPTAGSCAPMHDSESCASPHGWSSPILCRDGCHAVLAIANLCRSMQKELQEKLAQRGLPKSGNKADLAQRLHAALAEEQEMVLQDQVEAQYELQRQFQESMMTPASRCEHHRTRTVCLRSRCLCWQRESRAMPKALRKSPCSQQTAPSSCCCAKLQHQIRLKPAPEVGDAPGFTVNDAEAACRMGAEEQQDSLDPAGGIPEESFDQWAIDIEAEYQSPDDDPQLSLEAAEAAGATPGAVRVIGGASCAGPP